MLVFILIESMKSCFAIDSCTKGETNVSFSDNEDEQENEEIPLAHSSYINSFSLPPPPKQFIGKKYII